MRHSEYERPGIVLGSRDDAAARLRTVLDQSVAKLAALTEEQASAARIQGKWSPKQILGHLIDSAGNNHQRFVRAQIDGRVALPGYTQQEWVAVQRYQDRRWTELVLLWSAFNRHMAHVMECAAPETLQAPCEIGGDVSGTLEFLMIDYVCHLEHHLGQIFGTE